MIRISNMRVPVFVDQDGLKEYIASALGAEAGEIGAFSILKRSVDARRKSDVHFVYTVTLETPDEDAILKSNPGIAEKHTIPVSYEFPFRQLLVGAPPVIVGLGPAGLFAGLCLAEAGLKPVIIERGQPVEEREADVEHFWKTGVLDERSNVQFGEGGAGTFSDGKLTTGIGDMRIPYVLRRFVGFGAPEDILYLAKPHIGTDRLRHVVAAMRRHLIELGCDVRFRHRLSGLHFENGMLKAMEVDSGSGHFELPAEHLILAPGNSARDTFEMLSQAGVKLSAKNFSVGVRIEHLQKDIDLAQYGQAATLGTLPASDYKLAVHLDGGRSVYTFCVCPGGAVIASSSESGGVVTNGMSDYARDGLNSNGGLLVSVTPGDWDGSALGGIGFQRSLEQTAFTHGGSDYCAPAQRVGDFMKKIASTSAGAVVPTYRPGVRWCNLWDVLPDTICAALAEALPVMERSIRGFSNPDAVLTAVETRSSSPVRIDRTGFQADGFRGLYPCGEGAGYAGGIMSAAVDGIRAAEALCEAICKG
jgi:uncharacterized FAD-dependent dehydrogenase